MRVMLTFILHSSKIPTNSAFPKEVIVDYVCAYDKAPSYVKKPYEYPMLIVESFFFQNTYSLPENRLQLWKPQSPLIPDRPPVPKNFKVSQRTRWGLDLSWSSGGGSTAGFEIAVATGDKTPDCRSERILPKTQTSFSLSALPSGTSYTIALCAVDRLDDERRHSPAYIIGPVGTLGSSSSAGIYDQKYFFKKHSLFLEKRQLANNGVPSGNGCWQKRSGLRTRGLECCN